MSGHLSVITGCIEPCGSLTSHDESKTLHLLKWRSSCYSNLSASCPLQILIVLMFLLASCLELGSVFMSSDSEGWQKEGLRLEGTAWRGVQEEAGVLTRSTREAEMEVAIITKADCVGLGVLALLELYCTVVHRRLLPDLAFLPQMLTSAVCAVGLLWVWPSLWMLCCWRGPQCKDD